MLISFRMFQRVMQFLAFGDWLLANKIQSRINRDGYYKSPNPDKPEPKKKIKSAPRRAGCCREISVLSSVIVANLCSQLE